MGPEVRFGQLTSIQPTLAPKTQEVKKGITTTNTFNTDSVSNFDTVEFAAPKEVATVSNMPPAVAAILSKYTNQAAVPEGPTFLSTVRNQGRNFLSLNEKPEESSYVKGDEAYHVAS